MDSTLLFVICIIVIALAFDFINGFHDAANSIATVVSTRVLSPQHAVVWAAFFNLAAVFFIGDQVAKTVGTGIIHADVIDNYLILSALSGAIVWNLLTWWLGLPSSSSHALIGGLIGAGLVKGGTDVLVWSGNSQNDGLHRDLPHRRNDPRPRHDDSRSQSQQQKECPERRHDLSAGFSFSLRPSIV